MSRNAAAVGALVLVGGLLWLVTAWPTPEDDRPDPLEPEAPAEQPSPQPAAVPAEPAIGTPPKAPEPVAEKPAAAPPAQPQPAQPMRQPHAPPDDDMFAKEQGPVAEYKQLYETEPRDSAANVTESEIRAAFSAADGAPDLFKSVLCRQTVCKLDLRWSNDRMGPYIAGITRAAAGGFSPTVAVSPGGPLGDDKVRPIEVYIKRKPITTTELLPPPQPSAAQALAAPAAQQAPAQQAPAQPVPAPTMQAPAVEQPAEEPAPTH
jgi:hypothetical protein